MKNDPNGAKADLDKAAEIRKETTWDLRAAVPDSALTVGPPPLPEGVVAQVSDDITVSMLNERVERKANDIARQSDLTAKQAKDRAAEYLPALIAEMIKERFIIQQVQQLKLSAEIDRRLRVTSSTPQASNREQLRAQITRDLVFIRLIGWKVYFNPGSGEVQRYFDGHPEKFRGLTFNDRTIKSLMLEEWKNAELLKEILRISYIDKAEPYKQAAFQQLTDPVQLAADIPKGRPRKTKGFGQLSGEFVLGCFVVPAITRGAVGLGRAPTSNRSRATPLWITIIAAPGGLKLAISAEQSRNIRKQSRSIPNLPRLTWAEAWPYWCLAEMQKPNKT